MTSLKVATRLTSFYSCNEVSKRKELQIGVGIGRQSFHGLRVGSKRIAKALPSSKPAVLISTRGSLSLPRPKSATLGGDLQEGVIDALKSLDEVPVLSSTAACPNLSIPGLGQEHLHNEKSISSATVLTEDEFSSPIRIKKRRTVTVVKKRQDSLFKVGAVAFCDAFESVLVHIGRIQGLKSLHLTGNYAPVEAEVGPLPSPVVTGTIPKCLNGEFIRVNPNAKFKPRGNSSWFDGDGMLHGLRINDGKVTYSSRYVKTSRLTQEEYYGGSKFPGLGALVGFNGLLWLLLAALRTMLGILDTSEGWGNANTALIFHGGKLLCLHDLDKPYIIRVHDDGNLENVGQETYDGKLNHSFGAHPKIDPVTGELFMLGSNIPGIDPIVTYRVVSKGGEMRDPISIRTAGPAPSFIHDMAITEHYCVVPDCPMFFDPLNMVFKSPSPFNFDHSKPLRVGILPRYAQSDSCMQWFELPACMLMHSANAWEEGEEVVLITCRSSGFDFQAMNTLVNGEKGGEEVSPNLYEMRFNLRTGGASQKRLSNFVIEFPIINESYRGRKSRYVYTVVSNSGVNIEGIAKLDLTKRPENNANGNLTPRDMKCNYIAGVYWFGERKYGSEAVFVPSGLGPEFEEDDGYLICYAHDESDPRGKSQSIIIDAKSMSADPTAVIELHSRVPYGLHGVFIPEKQLAEQTLN